MNANDCFYSFLQLPEDAFRFGAVNDKNSFL